MNHDVLLFFGCTLILILVTYIAFKKSSNSTKFDVFGVKCLKTCSMFGNTFELFTQRRHILDVLKDNYEAFSNQRFIGFYYFGSKILILKDLNLIKKCCVEEFQSFHDHPGFVDDKIDPIFANNLFSLRGQKWHDMRCSLGHMFTKSSLSEVYHSVNKCAHGLVHYLGKQNTDLEVKCLFNLFTSDVIAKIAFGEETNCFSDSDDITSFFKFSTKMISQTRLRPQYTKMKILKLVLITNFPNFMKHFRKPVLSKDVSEYFKKIVFKNIQERKGETTKRGDLIQMLADYQIKNGKVWNDNELTAQSVIFLVSGFETMATFLSFLTYELATHPKVQERLQKEIDLNWKKLEFKNDEISGYSALNELQYLKMVVSEALRLWPPVFISDRKCTKRCDIGPPNDDGKTPYVVDLNECIWIPIYNIHRDPKYFENPDVFDPERFSEERIGNIQPYSYFPFGIGARACIAKKLALMEVYVTVVNILRNFNIKMSKKTQVPLKMDKRSPNMQAEGGIFVRFEPRN